MSDCNNEHKHQIINDGVWAGTPPEDYKLTITMHLKTPKSGAQNRSNEDAHITKHPKSRKYASYSSVAKLFSIEESALEGIKKFTDLYGLEITEKDLTAQMIKITGTVKQFSEALGVVFHWFTSTEGEPSLHYNGVLSLPEEVELLITCITGLQKGLRREKRSKIQTLRSYAGGYSPEQVANVYHFPKGTGKGEVIGLIELGGEYKQEDIEQYFKTFNLPMPEIAVVGTPTGNNTPINNLEVTLDIELAGGLAPEAKLVVYYGETINEAVKLALNDKLHKPSVLSISWALSELYCSPAEMEEYDILFDKASRMGVTVIAASGDHGAYNQQQYLNVNMPASHNLVTGCGGTELFITNGIENVWNDKNGSATGGGFSQRYQLPQYQRNAVFRYWQQFPTVAQSRGVPDVSANSDIKTPYSIVFNGQLMAMGAGTSASTPIWAALVARMNQELGYRLGFMNYLLYSAESSGGFKPVYNGNNNFYFGTPGWNPCTGLGAPHGEQLLAHIKKIEE